MESVPRGTLFVMPGHSGVYVDHPMNQEAAAQFLQELSKDSRVDLSKSALQVVQLLINKHGLVVVHKEDTENSPSEMVSVDPDSHKFRLATGGLLDLENVKAYVENGRIKPETGLTVIDSTGHIIGIFKAEQIECVRSLFRDHKDEPQLASYTIVAGSMPAISSSFQKIVDQFGLKDTDSVALTRRYGDDSTDSVVKAGGLHA